LLPLFSISFTQSQVPKSLLLLLLLLHLLSLTSGGRGWPGAAPALCEYGIQDGIMAWITAFILPAA
jgi:hypothetical protein